MSHDQLGIKLSYMNLARILENKPPEGVLMAGLRW